MNEEPKEPQQITDDLIPKPPSKLAPRGITSFTVYRQHDETGVSGDGVVIEGVVMATGQCVVHWLYPPPRGGIAIFDSMSDFVKVHIEPHPANQTIITYQDGHKDVYGTSQKKIKRKKKNNLLFKTIGDPHMMGGEQGTGSPAHFFLELFRISAILISYQNRKVVND